MSVWDFPNVQLGVERDVPLPKGLSSATATQPEVTLHNPTHSPRVLTRVDDREETWAKVDGVGSFFNEKHASGMPMKCSERRQICVVKTI